MHLYTHISKYTYKKTQINCVYTLFYTSPTLMQPFTEQYYMHLYFKKSHSSYQLHILFHYMVVPELKTVPLTGI